MLRSMRTLHPREPAEDGPATPPRSRTSLRSLETTEDGYGSAALTPDFLPGPARQVALREQQLAKAVEHIVTAPAPTMVSLAATLRVSRATAYRILAMPGFQEKLREMLTGRLAMTVQKAFAVVEHTMETGSPSLRLRAAQFLIERHDKLSVVAAKEPLGGPTKLDKDFTDLLVGITLNRLQREIAPMFPEQLTPELERIRAHLFKALTPKKQPTAEEELVDAALEDDDGELGSPVLTG